MKILFFLSFMLLGYVTGCKTNAPVSVTNEENLSGSVNFSEQSTWLLGYFTRERMTSAPHSLWHFDEYDNYTADNEFINQVKAFNTDDLTIKIVLGTWCSDSRREVPRFLKILDTWQFPASKITFIGVDNAKLSPVGEYESLNIERVPTFIIYKNNIEAGRIIENPTTSLEQDMVNILLND
jgi:thiol-disulfide isomerase/thioredoxin